MTGLIELCLVALLVQGPGTTTHQVCAIDKQSNACVRYGSSKVCKKYAPSGECMKFATEIYCTHAIKFDKCEIVHKRIHCTYGDKTQQVKNLFCGQIETYPLANGKEITTKTQCFPREK